MRWNFLGTAATVVAQIGYTATTARLVSPASFGAYAAAQALMGMAGYAGMSTLGNAVVRHPALTSAVTRTAGSLSVAAGAIAAALMIAIGSLWQHAWRVSGGEFNSLVGILALTVLVQSLGWVPLALLRRSLRFRAASAAETLSQLSSMSVGIACALVLRDARALALAQLAASVLLLAALTFLSRGAFRFGFDRFEAVPLLTFAGQVSAQNFGYYAIHTAPTWGISRFFGETLLGLYSRANLVMSLPLTYLSTALSKALYPLYPQLQSDPRRARVLIEESLIVTSGLAWPLFAALAGAAPLIVRVLLGSKWSGAAPLIPPFALYCCLNVVFVLLANAAEAFGWLNFVWKLQAVWALLTVYALALQHMFSFSPAVFLTVVAGMQVGVHALQLLIFGRRGFLRARTILGGELAHAALAAAVYGAFRVADKGLASQSIGVRCSADVALGVAFIVAGLALRRTLPVGRVLVRRRLLPSRLCGPGVVVRV